MSKDCISRAAKTFVQAFLGVLIPEIIALLNGGFVDLGKAWKLMSPFVAAAIAAGISAVWNMTREKISCKKEDLGA